MLSSSGPKAGDCFEVLTTAFVDGFEVSIPNVSKKLADFAKRTLLDTIQSYLVEITIKHILVTVRPTGTYIWFTLNHETSRVNPRTMIELTKVVNAMKLHAGAYWCLDKEESDRFEISKVDVAVDMKGSFIPSKGNDPYNNIKELLTVSVPQIFSSYKMNFLSANSLGELRVIRGDNILDTCY